MTTDGLEANLAVNYLGNFLLTTQLLAILNKSPDARVLCVNSSLHRIVSLSSFRGALFCCCHWRCVRSAFAAQVIAFILSSVRFKTRYGLPVSSRDAPRWLWLLL